MSDTRKALTLEELDAAEELLRGCSLEDVGIGIHICRHLPTGKNGPADLDRALAMLEALKERRRADHGAVKVVIAGDDSNLL